MITKIEEISDLEEFGLDLIKFRVYLRKNDGTDVNVPLTIYMWEVRRFMNIHERKAAAYINKISTGLRCYGAKDGKIVKALHEDGFPIHSFVEKYVKSIPHEKIDRHIAWAESREPVYLPEGKNINAARDFSFSSYYLRRTMFAETVDELVQKEIQKFYPDFFTNADTRKYAKYNEALMKAVNNFVDKMDDFLTNEFHVRK